MTTRHTTPDTIAFVCVQNAGRSQMAAAFAERERRERSLESQVEILTGGTDPADAVHDVVETAMDDAGIDVSDRQPREITPDEIESCDVVVTMGCSADGICPATWRGDARDWNLEDPAGRPLEAVREIRDDVHERVAALFDDLEAFGPDR